MKRNSLLNPDPILERIQPQHKSESMVVLLVLTSLGLGYFIVGVLSAI